MSEKTQNLVDTVENELGGQIIPFNLLPTNIYNFFTKYFSDDFLVDFMQCIKYSDNLYRLRLFNENREYTIRIDLDRDYIGCVMSNRKPYPGETWTRGSDYPDGEFHNAKEILHDILDKIFKTTFCPISKSVIK